MAALGPSGRSGRYSHVTFEEYCQERWEMAKDKAYRLIQYAEAAAKMSEISDTLPTRESHVRELLRLESDEDRGDGPALS